MGIDSTRFALLGSFGVAVGGATGGWRVLPEYGCELQLNTLVAAIDGGDFKGGDPVGAVSGGVTAQPNSLSMTHDLGGPWAWFGCRFKESSPSSRCTIELANLWRCAVAIRQAYFPEPAPSARFLGHLVRSVWRKAQEKGPPDQTAT